MHEKFAPFSKNIHSLHLSNVLRKNFRLWRTRKFEVVTIWIFFRMIATSNFQNGYHTKKVIFLNLYRQINPFKHSHVTLLYKKQLKQSKKYCNWQIK